MIIYSIFDVTHMYSECFSLEKSTIKHEDACIKGVYMSLDRFSS